MSNAEYSKLRMGAILTVEEDFFEFLIKEMKSSEYGGLTSKQIKLIANNYVNKEKIKNKKDFLACCSEYNIYKSGFFEEQSPDVYSLPIETQEYFQSLKSSNLGVFDNTKISQTLNDYLYLIGAAYENIKNLSSYENIKNSSSYEDNLMIFNDTLKYSDDHALKIKSHLIKNNIELINSTNNFSFELLNLEYVENESYEKYKKIERFKNERLIPFRTFFRKRHEKWKKTPAEMVDDILMILRKREEIIDDELKTTINSYKLLSKIIKSISGDFSGIVSKLSGLLESKEKDLEMQKTTSVFLDVLKREQSKLADGSVQRVNSWYLPVISTSTVLNAEITKELQGEGSIATDEISVGLDAFFEKISEKNEIETENIEIKEEMTENLSEKLKKNKEEKMNKQIKGQISSELTELAKNIIKSNNFLLGEELDIFNEVLTIFKNNYKNTNNEINPNMIIGGVNKITKIIKSDAGGRFRTKRIKKCDYLNKSYQILVFKKNNVE